MANLPRVAILGRPNVGKSTLFNRICGRRRALVGNEPGMTRDRLYSPAEWQGKSFEVVDTGGMVPAEKELIPSEIFRQAGVAIDEAAHLILVVDARAGVVPLDEELAQMLRRTGKPLSLAVNKIDSLGQAPLAAEFHRLGVREIFPVSAEHGLGVDDLLDRVTADFGSAGVPFASLRAGPTAGVVSPEEQEGDSEIKDSTGIKDAAGGTPALPTINVAIIGRPNVGKSTLLNRLLDQERSIVTPAPGTTRDAVDAELERDGHRFRLVDTAGIRRKGKTKLLAEKLSVIQARKHLERSDVALLMIDAVEGVSALDTHIGGYAHEGRRSVVVVVNKWDAIQKCPTTTQDYTQTIRRRMKYLDYAPIVFISAQKGQRLGKLLGTIVEVAAARRYRVPTAAMNRFVRELDFERVPSPRGPGNKPLRLYYLTQAGVAPPTFVAFTNRAGKLHFSVERYLENRIREQFGFAGTPIVIKSRARQRRA
ncbi:MAG: ribosome biogenesis GTPase Der [Acidobacteria bacterium]|nr:MAG: ribosome biogenesis GTPase Der [Acidobacteriota bacterium]